MFAEALIFFSAPAERFALACCHSEREFFGCVATKILSAYGCEIFSDACEHLVGQSGKAFAETQIVDCIEQIAFTHAVVAQQTVDFWGKRQRRFGDVFEIGDREVAKFHSKDKITK